MAQYTPVKAGLNVWRDPTLDNVLTSTLRDARLLVPPQKGILSPTSLLNQGEVAYDSFLETVIYSNGTMFLPTGGTGTVTSISEGTDIALTPNPITTVGTVALADSGVAPGTYNYVDLTVNAQGLLTAAASGTATIPTIPTAAVARVIIITSTATQTIVGGASGVTLTFAAPNPVDVNNAGSDFNNPSPGIFTCSATGDYFFSFSLSGAPGTPGLPAGVNASIVLNGSTSLAESAFPMNNYTSPQISLNATVGLTAGDTIQCLVAFFETGGSTNFSIGFAAVSSFLVAM